MIPSCLWHNPVLHCLALKGLFHFFLQVHLLSCADPNQPLRLVQSRTAGLEYFVSHSQGQLYILTNANGAANYQLMTAPLHTPCSAHWKPLVPERPGTAVEDLEVYASHAVLYERQQGRPAVSVLNLLAQASKAAESQQQAAGTLPDSPDAWTSKQQQTAHVVVEEQNMLPISQRQQHELEQNHQQQQQQPGATTAEHAQPAQQPQLTALSFPSWALSIQPGANPEHDTRSVRLHVASPVHPLHMYDYHLDTGQLQLLGAEQLQGHDPEQYVCQVQHATAADGTQVTPVKAEACLHGHQPGAVVELALVFPQQQLTQSVARCSCAYPVSALSRHTVLCPSLQYA